MYCLLCGVVRLTVFIWPLESSWLTVLATDGFSATLRTRGMVERTSWHWAQELKLLVVQSWQRLTSSRSMWRGVSGQQPGKQSEQHRCERRTYSANGRRCGRLGRGNRSLT